MSECGLVFAFIAWSCGAGGEEPGSEALIGTDSVGSEQWHFLEQI